MSKLMDWPLSIELNSKLYSISSIRKTIYLLADRLSIKIDLNEDEFYKIEADKINLLDNINKKEAYDLIIRNINDFSMREQIALETNNIRLLLLKVAFNESLKEYENNN